MKIVFCFFIYSLLFCSCQKSCLEGKVNKIVVKHTEFYSYPLFPALPRNFDRLESNDYFMKTYTDPSDIHRIVQLLKSLELQSPDSVWGIDVRAKIELYQQDTVCNVYLDYHAVIIEGVEYKTSQALRDEVEKTLVPPWEAK